jgi:tetratricopeptide (TPR) repeat protein
MKRLLTTVVAAALIFGPVPGTVWAQDSDTTRQVEELSGKAASAYKKGDYEQAIELFQQAYELQAVPNLLFNIAKVYEKLEKWDEAIANYRKFVTAPDADSSAREIALERIDQLEEAQRAREEEAEKQRLAEEKRREEEQRKAEQREEAEQTAVVDEGGSGGKTAAWIVTGSGLGLLAGGAVFGTLAATQQSRFRDGETADARRDARDKGQTYALVADSMFVAGAVATTVGVILLFVTSDSETDAQTAALPVGWVGDSEAGVGVRLRF